jgi:hypothetical protein
MKTLLLTIAALVTAVGCVQAPVASEAPASVETVTYEQEVDPSFCQVIFTPDAATLEETTLVAARWAKATECDIRVGEGGIPVIQVETLLDDEGNSHEGGTTFTSEGPVLIRVLPVRRPVVMPHEMGHALSGRMVHVMDDHSVVGHTGAGPALITAGDLEMVCEVLNCQGFNPEA